MPRKIIYARSCPKCSGSGEMSCPECNGSGYDPYDGGQCSKCAGTGEVTCTRCEGSGEIESKGF